MTIAIVEVGSYLTQRDSERRRETDFKTLGHNCKDPKAPPNRCTYPRAR